jgi:TPP-dependent pyruvate/acetoin dehydrogenase alpha subunit
LREKGATEAQWKESQGRAKKVNDEALEFAMKSEPPTPDTVGEFVFA